MHLRGLISLIPFYLLFVTDFSHAWPQKYSFLDDETDAFIRGVLADWKSPGGVAVAFVRRNERGEWVDIETKGYGIATAYGKRVNENTTFNIGSNSKVILSISHIDKSPYPYTGFQCFGSEPSDQ
jgi:CubicO group peptidase (beta-lactamase class C family)